MVRICTQILSDGNLNFLHPMQTLSSTLPIIEELINNSVSRLKKMHFMQAYALLMFYLRNIKLLVNGT